MIDSYVAGGIITERPELPGAGAGGLRVPAMGCMRLSSPELDEEQALSVLGAALAAGVRLFDTADVYAPDHKSLGHNERLLSRMLARHPALRGEIVIATKGGLTRRARGPWLANGKARYLRRACEASLRALDLPRLDLYQLHAPDPQVPLSTSVKALAELQRAGLVERIGLCNVTLTQLRQARDLAEIAAVQVALSPFEDEAIYGGVVAFCAEHDITLLAHTPLGGIRKRPKLARHKPLRRLAQDSGVSVEMLALRWLRGLAPVVVPLPGATRVETAATLGSAMPPDAAMASDAAMAPGVAMALGAAMAPDARARAVLDAYLPAAKLLTSSRQARRAACRQDGEVVLIMGIQGAGKSRAAEPYLRRGYQRLNRDERGGRLRTLVRALDEGLAAGQLHWVLDNTYASRASRARVVEAAFAHGVPVRCVYLDTPLFEAQINVVRRLLAAHGTLPDHAALKLLAKRDPQALAPTALFRYERALERPADDEGFSVIEVVPFQRDASTYGGRAAFIPIECLRRSRAGARSPLSLDDLQVLAACAQPLRDYQQQGYRLIAFGWRPAIAEGKLDNNAAQAIDEATVGALDVPMAVARCPHGAGPPRCWCRPPLPGMFVQQLDQGAFDPAGCLMVARSAADRTAGERLGMQVLSAEDVFAVK